MVTIITATAKALSGAYLSLVFQIDLMVFLILIGLLIFMSFYNQHDFPGPETKLHKGKILYLAIVPFFYVFCYVLIYRVLSAA